MQLPPFISDAAKRNKLLGLVLALSCSFMLFPFFFEGMIVPVPGTGPSWLTLDPSWQITLNKANIDHLNWGNDFIITYGPLSYLSTRNGWCVNRFHFLLFDLFVCFNFFYLFYISFKKSDTKFLTALLIIFSSLLLPLFSSSGAAIVLMAMLIFWIRQSLEHSRFFFYVMQITIVVLLFFMKFNTGLTSFVFFFVGICYQLFFTREKKLPLIIYAVVPLIAVYILAGILNVSILPYLKGGLNMIAGHNEIMYLDENYVNELGFCVTVLCLGLLLLILKTIREKQLLFKNLVTLFLFCCAGYTLYKQGFTRADAQHISEFYNYFLLLLLCIQDFHYTPINRYSYGIVITMLFITFFFSKRRDPYLFNLDKHFSKADYISGFKNHTDTSCIFMFPNNNQMPQSVKAAIGQSRCDVYPWNSHLLLENRLNYRPRPVFQSYIAYTQYLENLNFNFYNSNQAPDYVLYEYDAIDGRYPLFDEPKVNLTLLRNYNCTDTFSFAGRPVLVLKKNAAAQPLRLQQIRKYEKNLGDPLHPSDSLYYEIYASNTLKGKLISALKYSPELYLLVNTKDGQQRQYRTSKKLLESGLFSNRAFTSTSDVFHYLEHDSLPDGQQVSSYQLLPKDATLFNDKITVVEYRIY